MRSLARPAAARALQTALLAALALALPAAAATAKATTTTLQHQKAELLAAMQTGLGLTAAELAAVAAVVDRSAELGQGNPAVSRHPMTPEECRQSAAADPGPAVDERAFAGICGAPNMAPLYDPARETATEATACIDQYEFPNLPCAYPVVWVRASEAAALCQAVGKRMCDAHEWEGACAGSLEPPDYRFELAEGVRADAAVARMRVASNHSAATAKVWSYGPTYRTGVCATGSQKTPGCNGGDWRGCGSNTYPAGSFPACHSSLGVYDLNGNVAEHMNLPLASSQLASQGSRELGVTEMKGSWFVFDRVRAHDDSCRWRAPFWHGSRVLDAASHRNYHLGFRCCKTLSRAADGGTPTTPSGQRATSDRHAQ